MVDMATVSAKLYYRRREATLKSFSDGDVEKNFEWYSKAVCDGRPLKGELSLFENGFVLADHRTTDVVNDWYNPEHVRSVYYPGIKRLVQQLVPSAFFVLPLNHISRNEGDSSRLGPHHVVHNDFTDAFLQFAEQFRLPVPSSSTTTSISGNKDPNRLRRTLQSSRLVMLNLWRPTRPEPLRRNPLALCDRRSIDRSDLVPTLLPSYATNTKSPLENLNLEVFTSKNNDGHKWYYFSDLTQDEVMAFVTFDSHPESGVFVPTMHSAISLPGQEGEPPRESCEIRVLCLLPLPAAAKEVLPDDKFGKARL